MAKIEHNTLSASTVDTVTLDAYTYKQVTVMNRSGSNEIFWTVGGAAPTVEGDDTYVTAASAGATTSKAVNGVNGQVTVKLISSGAEDYSVIGV